MKTKAIHRLNPGDVEVGDGCNRCDVSQEPPKVGRSNPTFYLVEREEDATDLVLCSDCVGTEECQLRSQPINGAAQGLLTADQVPCPMPFEGQIYQDGDRMFRVTEVNKGPKGIVLVLQDVDDPQHRRTREIGGTRG